MLLNSMIAPSVPSAVYFIITIVLTALMMAKTENQIQIKIMCSLIKLISAVLILIAKIVITILINKKGESLNLDD